jgi:peptidoglycan L-alanyl-D-glutamate endopeptidase CwlK
MKLKGEEKLVGVHELLTRVVNRAAELSSVSFGISEGLRTLERQRQLLAAGKSQTMKSYHLSGKAVDVYAIVDGRVSWEWKYYEAINKAFQEAAKELGAKITWGGSWKTLKDGPHFQLEI